MKRVGTKVMTTEVDLSTKGTDLSIWNRYTLNLGSIMNAEKGALYQIQVWFKPEDSVFPCMLPFEAETVSESDGWSIYDN